MSPEGRSPDDPRVWLEHARGDLALARTATSIIPRALYAFHAQQAAEKAIKAICVDRAVEFPYVHDLDRLLDVLAERGEEIPDAVRDATILTPYAVETRYPFAGDPVMKDELDKAIAIAETILTWAENAVGPEGNA